MIPTFGTRLVLQWWSGDEGIFILEDWWRDLNTIQEALNDASTWADLEREFPQGEFESLSIWAVNGGQCAYLVEGELRYADPDSFDQDEGPVFTPEDRFNGDELAGDDGYPRWLDSIFTDLPEEFVRSFSRPVSSMVSGAWHQYPLDQEEAMREALAAQGFELVFVAP